MTISTPIVLSHFQVRPMIDAQQAGVMTAETSPDLGLSRVTVRIEADGVYFPDGERLTWADAATIIDRKTACFSLIAGEIAKLQVFSEQTNRLCSLMPTSAAPTMLLAGFPMHRIKDTDPYQDTISKIKAISPVSGHVLDTTTGLGYTAIQASHVAARVTTIELDPAVIALARQNPWSRELFDNPNITQKMGDTFEVITEFEDGAFSRIVHDPPTFSLAGDLYSAAFYKELYRVLRRGGRLFHYIGDLSNPHGKRISRGAMQRLQQVGFQQVRPFPVAFGLIATK